MRRVLPCGVGEQHQSCAALERLLEHPSRYRRLPPAQRGQSTSRSDYNRTASFQTGHGGSLPLHRRTCRCGTSGRPRRAGIARSGRDDISILKLDASFVRPRRRRSRFHRAQYPIAKLKKPAAFSISPPISFSRPGKSCTLRGSRFSISGVNAGVCARPSPFFP